MSHSLLPTVARHDADQLGEGPVWDEARQRLLSVDISNGVVHRWDPTTGEDSKIRVAGEVSAAVPRANGGLLLARGHELVLMDEDGEERILAQVETDLAENRFNDCRCDPAGRLWAGTMSKTRSAGSAGLYRLDPGGEIARVLDGTTISNGIAWSGSGELIFFIDSTTQRIDVFDFDAASGGIDNRRRFVAIDPGDGLPDGMTVDAEDCIWVALFGGGAVRRYTPEGVLDAVVELPTSNPTCPAFGGPELETLYVTSARHRLSPAELADQPLAGALFAIEPGVRGRPSPPFAG